jgi:flagellar protein FliS
MWNNGHDTYLESKVLSADPVELVNMLYEACTGAVREARYHLADGRIAERSREINKAYQILAELTLSLDHERGGEISQRLALLYDYMQRRLLDANMQQAEAPLAEVLGLLSTLSEAWAGVRSPSTIAAMEAPGEWKANPKAEAASPWAQVPSPWAQTPIEEVAGARSLAWSL